MDVAVDGAGNVYVGDKNNHRIRKITAGGVVTKLRLLSIEGAQPGGPTLFDRLPLALSPRRR